MQRIVDESNKKIVEAVATAGANQSVERKRFAGELLQAVNNLGTRQSAGHRLLARELAGLTVRIPSHAVLLPPREDESPEMTDAEREESSWIQRLKDWRAHGKRGGKGVVSKEFRWARPQPGGVWAQGKGVPDKMSEGVGEERPPFRESAPDRRQRSLEDVRRVEHPR